MSSLGWLQPIERRSSNGWLGPFVATAGIDETGRLVRNSVVGLVCRDRPVCRLQNGPELLAASA